MDHPVQPPFRVLADFGRQGASEVVDAGEAFGGGESVRVSECSVMGPQTVAEALDSLVVDRPERCLVLTRVGDQGLEFDVDRGRDVLDVVDLLGLPEQQRLGSVMLEVEFGQEVGITRCNDGVTGEPTGGSVVGMEAVPFPGVVSEDHIRAKFADRSDHLGTRLWVVGEFSIDPAEESHFTGAVATEQAGCSELFDFSDTPESVEVGGGVPGPLGPIGADQMVDLGARLCPFGQGATAAELDVIGMRADGQCSPRDGQIGVHASLWQAGLAGLIRPTGHIDSSEVSGVVGSNSLSSAAIARLQRAARGCERSSTVSMSRPSTGS